MKEEKVGLVFAKMSLKLAEHNLEVEVKTFLEKLFRSVKADALLDEEKAKALDSCMRSLYDDQPKKIAEWEQVMQRYEFSDDEIDVGE